MNTISSISKAVNPSTLARRLRTACAVGLLPLLLLLTLPAGVQAQFTFTTNNDALTITGYTGSGGAVIIPDATNGLPVTSIGSYAFQNKSSLTSVTIPDSVTSIGTNAFSFCNSLTNVTIGNSVTSIGVSAFAGCINLTNVKIPNGVTSIRDNTFRSCYSLTNVTIGNSVTNIGYQAFVNCGNLTGVYFKGNAPSANSNVGFGSNVNVYYLPGTAGWGATFAGRPTALWKPQMLTSDDNFGVRTNQFGFNISWASGMDVAVDACTDLANPVWSPLQTNTLTGDTLYFSDPQWTNYPARFYRLRWP